MDGLFAGERFVPSTLTGAPLNSERAIELALIISDRVEQYEINALIELLAGIAPSMEAEAKLKEIGNKRIRDKELSYPPEEVARLLADLWGRYCAAVEAISILFSQSDSFVPSVEQYMEANKLIKPFVQNEK